MKMRLSMEWKYYETLECLLGQNKFLVQVIILSELAKIPVRKVPGLKTNCVSTLALSFFALLWVADRRVIRMPSSKFHTEM